MKSGDYENLEDKEFEAQECDIKENGGQVFFTCP
ncbi:hypothetical protein OVS_04210 [Mycoplasma ovis str. Michigan]|uniref:Uncharacterized protein n=1 Tax=Mycoplasma ovis str. Michigan TaxID=1415773 RepID=A0ABN4BS44_9MOLU|nr:hypothetical protein OVS_04210 [Mycoplasma ovis str. Michigan]